MSEMLNTPDIQSENNEKSQNKKARRKIGFHPKRFLKNIQTKLSTSPYLYLIFCFLVPVILMYGIYVIKGIHPFYNGSVLVLDLNAQYVSFFEAFRDFVLGERSILYSFSRSLGGEFMGMVAYYMASPLTYLIVLFPKDRIQEAVLTLLLIKCGLTGLTFGFYLHKKSRNPQKVTIFTFSLLYALSAYAVVQQHNTMWIDALVWLPLFAYGLENLVYRKKYKLYTISLAVIMICNYYIGFMVCIFAVLYFFYCYYSKAPNERNPYGEKLHLIKTGGRFAIFSLFAAAISAFMLIAAYYSLQFGKTEFSEPNWNMGVNFDVVDFLTKFLPGSYDTVEPTGLPFVYCGIITLILLPVYFLSKKITSREKIASLALVAVLILSLIIKPLDLIWHGFSMPNWLNSRYSFLLIFVLLIMAYKAYGNLKSVGETVILAASAIIIMFAAIAQKFELESFITSDEKLLVLGCVFFSIAFAIILAALLCFKLKAVKHEKAAKAFSGVLAAVICLELFCNGIVCILQFHEDVSFTSYKSYNTFLAELRPVVADVKEYDSSFYRMEKVRHRSKNDNMALGIYGITNSTSTLNQKAIDLIAELGYTGRSHGTMYNGGTAVGDSILGIKYVIDYNTSTKFDNLYTKVESIESPKYSVYENPNALSLAYGVNESINEFDCSEYESYFNRYNALITAMLGEENTVNLFKHVRLESISSASCTENKRLSQIKYTTEDNDGMVFINYIAPESGYYYFYSDGYASNELKISINNSSRVNYLGKDSNHIIIGGYFEEGSYISVQITIPEETEFTIQNSQNFLWYFTMEEYNEVFARLKSAPQFDIAASASTEDTLVGTIETTQEKQTILTTIPYDKGWKVYVDGEMIETYETLNALMAFDIEGDGKHVLELKYRPTEYLLGFSISATAIISFIAICVVDFVLKKTILKKRIRVYEKDYFVLDDIDIEYLPPVEEVLESNKSGCENYSAKDTNENIQQATDADILDEANLPKDSSDESNNFKT